MSFDELKRNARAQINNFGYMNVLIVIVVSFIWGMILSCLMIAMMFALFIPAFLDVSYEVFLLITFVWMILFYAIIFPIAAIMQWGTIENEKKMYRGEQSTIQAGFSGLKNKRASLSTFFLPMLFVLLWMLIPFVGFIIAMVKSYSYGMAMHIRNENPNKTARECITESRRIMNGNKLRLFCYDLYFMVLMFLIMLAGSFTFGLAFVLLYWFMPYVAQVKYNFYQNIKRK